MQEPWRLGVSPYGPAIYLEMGLRLKSTAFVTSTELNLSRSPTSAVPLGIIGGVKHGWQIIV